MGIRDRPTAPRSPWQNGYAERLIGSIRRECLDHVIIIGEPHLRHVLRSYARYYNGVRTHLSLGNRYPETSRRSGAFSRCRSSADCTTITSGSNFRQGQPAFRLHKMRRPERQGDADLPACARYAGVWEIDVDQLSSGR